MGSEMIRTLVPLNSIETRFFSPNPLGGRHRPLRVRRCGSARERAGLGGDQDSRCAAADPESEDEWMQIDRADAADYEQELKLFRAPLEFVKAARTG